MSLKTSLNHVLALYPCFLSEYIFDCLPLVPFVTHVLKEWQQTIYAKLSLPPADREIVFLVDCTGNAGKSWFTRYVSMLLSDVQI